LIEVTILRYTKRIRNYSY